MNKFYDGSELLSRSKYNIFFSLGGRNIGKSTFWQRYIIRHYIKYKEKFGIIVKYKDDLSTFAPNYFSQDWMDKWYPDYEIMYRRGKYFIRNKSDKKDDEDMKSGWRECGYAIALNLNASLKSTTTYQDISNLLFEEFMPLEDRYIKSSRDPEKEPKLLQSVYQTIARGAKGKRTRKVRLILISNNYTLNNPYFTFFRILNMVTNNPNSIYQQFYTYDKGSLHYALEFSQLEPERTGIERDDDSVGVKFADYRNELKYMKNNNIKHLYFQLTFDNKKILSVAKFNDTIAVFESKRDENYNCYSCSTNKTKDMMGIRVFKNSNDYKVLVRMFEMNVVYYDKLESFIWLTNIIAYS